MDSIANPKRSNIRGVWQLLIPIWYWGGGAAYLNFPFIVNGH